MGVHDVVRDGAAPGGRCFGAWQTLQLRELTHHTHTHAHTHSLSLRRPLPAAHSTIKACPAAKCVNPDCAGERAGENVDADDSCENQAAMRNTKKRCHVEGFRSENRKIHGQNKENRKICVHDQMLNKCIWTPCSFVVN